MRLNVRFVFGILATSSILAALSLLATSAEEGKSAPAAAPHKLIKKSVPAEEKIRAALLKPCHVDFVEAHLSDVASALAHQYEINVRLDTKALDGVGIGNDTPITVTVNHVSLRSALELMLRDLELTWLIQHETLMITTPEVAEENLHTRVYDVRDLVDPDGTFASLAEADPLAGEGVYPDFDSLIELTTTTIAPDTWDDVGGPGSIDSFYSSKAFALVVSQTDPVHDQIEKLFADLRALEREHPHSLGRPKVKKTSSNSAAAPRITVGIYPIIDGKGPPLDELVELIREVIGPDQFNENSGTAVRGIAQTIVVRHNHDVQRRVVQTLQKIGAIDSSIYPLGPYYSGR